MKKTIVLIFLGDFFYDARCINMANSIINKGYKLFIIDVGKLKNKYRGSKIFHIKINSVGFLRYALFYQKAKKIIQKLNPDLIIASDLYSLPSAFSLKNSEVIYDSREIYCYHAGMINNKLKQFFWYLIEKKFINKTKSVLVTADGDELILNKIYKNLNIIKIYNYPSIKFKNSNKKILRKKLNLFKDEKIFLYQGVLHPGRGIKNMIYLLKYFLEAHAVIIGEGPYKKNIINFIKKYNLINRVHILGKIEYNKLLAFTSGADIGFSLIKPISKSYEQALPNKLFEYALCEVPIICSDLIEMKNIIVKYKIGFAVNCDDYNKQKKAIEKIFNNNKYFFKNLKRMELTWENQENRFLQAIN